MSERNTPREGQAKPLYYMLAQSLAKDISDGTLGVGAALPSEKVLTILYRVSRQTVRKALSLLRIQGLIASRPGVGTIVLPPPQRAESLEPITSARSLEEYLEMTDLHHVATSVITVNERQSDLLECRRGSQLSEACFLRKRKGRSLPLGAIRVYLPTKYAAAQITPKLSKGPIYKNLAQMFGIAISQVRQDLVATVLDRETAELLQATPGEPALQVIRFYYSSSGQPIEIAVCHYPSSRVRQTARYKI